MFGSAANARTLIGPCLWPTLGARSTGCDGPITSAVLTLPWADLRQPNVLHLPGLTPADEGRKLTLCPDTKPGDLQRMAGL